jgi:hypothetical protein
VRGETVGGTKAAVVEGRFSLPFRFTRDFDKLLALAGKDAPGGDALAGASVVYRGSGAGTRTAWVDAEAGKLLKSTTSMRFAVRMAFKGFSA